jgi:hypothetical protein
MQAFLTRRGIFAASMLTISAIAATSTHASADDAGVVDDGGAADATPLDSATEAGSVPDATGATGSDATVAATDASAEAATGSGLPMYITPDGGPPAYSGGDIFQRLCVQNPGVMNFSFTTVIAPYAAPASCKTYNDEGHNAAHSCMCDNCFTLMQQCDALPGCREILKCQWDAGCTDSTTCYLAPGAPCAAPIDAWGTGSVSTALTQYLTTCGAKATPPCPTQ